MNRLSMRREFYEGVTDLPHFVVEIDYEECRVCFEDIYFDAPPALAQELEALEREREGRVVLDGGPRFGLDVALGRYGELLCSFRAEPDSFPGKLRLEGFFNVDGEFTGLAIHALGRLLTEGRPVTLYTGYRG